jgi:hypothetical protein
MPRMANLQPRAITLGVVAGLAMLLVTPGAAPAQQATPEAAVQAALAALAPGYSARFTRTGGSELGGEVRFLSATSYALRVEDDRGSRIEYVFLDPDLYLRRSAALPGESDWTRQLWHPDAPLRGVDGIHPRLPLELLRAARDLRDVGLDPVTGDRRLDGTVSYWAAFKASYEDGISALDTPTVAATRWPLSIWLTPAGGVRLIELTFPEDNQLEVAPGVLSYAFDAVPPVLAAPAAADDIPSSLQVRPTRDGRRAALPLAESGSGATIRSSPFRSATGTFGIRLDPSVSGLDYSIWRIKRDRQLVATVGRVVGSSPVAVIPVTLPPGEYVVEVTLPEAADWSITIEDTEVDLNTAPS